jgi:hypothetical protein
VHVPLVGALRPWQLAFLVVGVPGLLVAAWLLALREPPRRGAGASKRAAPFRAVLAWLRTHARAYGCHFAVFALLSVVFNATIAWLPSVFVRVHGWAPGAGAFWIGCALLTFGTAGIIAGGISADAWRQRGWPDGSMRVGLKSALGVLPFAATAPTASSPELTIALLAPLLFFSAFAFGDAAAGMQWLTPPTVRAQVSALFLFVNNLVGIGGGPVAVALLTDRVYGVPQSVGTSLAIVAGAAAALAAIVQYAGIGASDDSVRSIESGSGHGSGAHVADAPLVAREPAVAVGRD